jgi:outer membrane protein assembly factor BamD (BamD/ComL family)
MSPSKSSGSKSFGDRLSAAVRSQITDNYHDSEADAKMQRAEELFAAGDYKEAESIFADLADNTYNAAMTMEKARYMEAESVRMQGKLPRAVDTYHRLLKDFPASVYTEKAAVRMYAIVDVWLKDSVRDIEERQAGKNWFQRYRFTNPLDPSKPKTDQEGEVLKTLDNIATHAPNSSVADKAMFWCGYLHYAHGDYADADHYFSLLSQGYKDSPLRQEAAKYAVAAKNRSTGGAAYDGQKSAEALQLVHNLEATDPVYTQDKDKSAWLQRQKMAIRVQQAEKDFETAEYYRRSNHPSSAIFYYELTRRRYPGTKYSDLAVSRIAEMEQIRKQREADKAAGKQSPLEVVQEKFEELGGGKKKPEDPVPGREPATGPKEPQRLIPLGAEAVR